MNMVQVALSFLLGVLLFQASRELPSVYCLLLVPIAILLCWKIPRLLLVWIAALAYCWAYVFALIIIYPQLSSQLEGEDIQVDGFIIEIKSESSQYSKFIYQIDKQSIAEWNSRVPEKVVLSWYRPAQIIKQNQHCQFVVRLKKHWGFSNPGFTDHEKNMFIRGIGARGYVRSGQCTNFKSTQSEMPSLRQRWISDFSEIASRYQYSDLMEALTFGYRDNIDQEKWQVLRDTGTSHLLAISGLHLSAISLVVFAVVGRLCRCSAWLCERVPAQCVAAIFAIIAAIFYAYMAGFSLPTQRALVMVMVGLLAILLRRPVINISLFASALLIVLVVNPLAVLNAGFWMSFLAVLFIFIVVKSTQGKGKVMRILAVQAYLGAALFPIGLLFFSQASIISPVVNLVAIPLVSFVLLPLLLVTQILFLLDVAVSFSLFQVLDQLFAGLWWLLHNSAEFKFSSLEFTPTLLGVVSYELDLFMLVQAKGLPARHLAWILLAALYFIKQPSLTTGQMRMTVLDVGQGLAIVIETQHHSLIYDAGVRSLSGFNTGSAVVLPYMKSHRIQHFDLAMVSHNDNDHSGGIHSLLQDGVIKKLMVSNRPELYAASNTALCRAGDAWQWDRVTFQVFYTHQANGNLTIIIALAYYRLPIQLAKFC